MKSRLKATATAIIVIAGMSVTLFAQKLYPVQGPLAISAPQTIYKGHVEFRVMTLHSPFYLLKSWTVANGEVLKGKVVTIKKAPMNTVPLGSPAGYPPQPDLASAWDAVFGPGFFVAHILGNPLSQGIFKDSQGTVLQVETLDQRNGVAIDNKGNVYKLAW